MVKALKKKLILIAMLAMSLGILAFVLLINGWNYYNVCVHIDQWLDVLEENDGELNIPSTDGNYPIFDKNQNTFTKDMAREVVYFSVIEHKDGRVELNRSNMGMLTDAEIATVFESINKISDGGFTGDYKYRCVDKVYGRLYLFVDCSREFDTYYAFCISTVILAAIGWVVVYVLVRIFAKVALHPVVESYEKQKSFITDASHEIKTPIAIIRANTEILEMEGGESEWTTGIINQTDRLRRLTERLVYLSRMEEGVLKLRIEEFCLSDAVFDMAEPFEALAIANEKHFQLNIEGDVFVTADEESVKQLVSIFLDNAMKYSNDGGSIEVIVRSQGKHAELIVKNTVDKIEKGKLDRLFDRFYRADSSRNSKTGGYGIGLSVARAIVEANNGKVTAESKDGKSIEFVVTL